MSRGAQALQFGLLVLFTMYFVWWLRDPPYELHAMIHVVPTWLAIAVLVASIRCFPLSHTSFTLLVTFLALHVLGTRYIYTYVPYDDWSLAVFGTSVSDTFGLERNHYDRFVHLAYGLLIAPAAREVKVRLGWVQGPWSYLAAIEFVLAASLTFELLEWIGAVRLAPDFADSYLGQQGDIWDAHKDMALAGIGATVGMTVAACVALVRRPA